MESVKLLLEAGANPTLKGIFHFKPSKNENNYTNVNYNNNAFILDINSKTAYDIAKNKETRLIMRSFAGKHLDMWDYTLARIIILYFIFSFFTFSLTTSALCL